MVYILIKSISSSADRTIKVRALANGLNDTVYYSRESELGITRGNGFDFVTGTYGPHEGGKLFEAFVNNIPSATYT